MKAVIADDFFTYLSISAFTHAIRSFDISKKTKQIFVKIRRIILTSDILSVLIITQFKLPKIYVSTHTK